MTELKISLDQLSWKTLYSPFRNTVIAVILILASAHPVVALDYWVSIVSGLDTNPGSQSLPFKTIQKRLNNATPGSTINILAGSYPEKLVVNKSGSTGLGPIILKGEAGNPPVLDGSPLIVPDSDSAMVLINGQGHITLEGLVIEQYKTADTSRVPMGIFITGPSHDITLTGNTIRNIETLGAGDAHGIAVYGNHAFQAVTNIIIKDNTIHSLLLGSSEAVVLNGNVTDFTVTGNHIYDCDNIAIDAIGYEGVCPDPNLDRVRNGTISFNRIHDISSHGNPAYGNTYAAGGIYVDGGSNIIIQGNNVKTCDIGIEIASEHSGKTTDHIIVRSNFLYANRLCGLAMGGYDSLRGSTTDCIIIHNSLYKNNTLMDGNGELMIQYDTKRNHILNNIFFANSQGLFISNPYTLNMDNTLDNNLYYASLGASGSQWQWKTVTHTGFSSYQAATGNDSVSFFSNPIFLDEALPDLHIMECSSAVDKGMIHGDAGSLDIDGQARTTMLKPDIGADELCTRPQPPSNLRITQP